MTLDMISLIEHNDAVADNADQDQAVHILAYLTLHYLQYRSMAANSRIKVYQPFTERQNFSWVKIENVCRKLLNQ